MPDSDLETPAEPYYLVLGKITRPHGIRGELRLEIATRLPGLLDDLDTVFLGHDPFDKDGAAAWTLRSHRQHQQNVLLTLEGVDDRTAAEALQNKLVMVPLRETLPLEEGEIYFFQLIGMAVYTETGEYLGDVAEIMETGANNVYLLRGGRRGEVLIPDTDEVIRSIDAGARRITITPIPGLLPGDEITDADE
jgi:16S rRNA processing protein RimM